MSRLMLPRRFRQLQGGFIMTPFSHQGSEPGFSFALLQVGTAIVLSNSNRTASVTSNARYDWAICSPVKNSGKWIWEFSIDSIPATTGSIAVGMSQSPGNGITTDEDWAQVLTGFTWFVRRSGALARFYYGGASGAYDSLTTATQSFNTGDIVTCTVDFATKEVKIYRNGTLIYTKTVSSINTGTWNYAPMVKIWGTATPATVTCRSSITYPVAGFSPWA